VVWHVKKNVIVDHVLYTSRKMSCEQGTWKEVVADLE